MLNLTPKDIGIKDDELQVKIDNETFKIVDILGTGAFCSAYKAFHIVNNNENNNIATTTVAIKCPRFLSNTSTIKRDDDERLKVAYNELKILLELTNDEIDKNNNNNIVQLFNKNAKVDNNNTSIILKDVGTPLSHWLYKNYFRRNSNYFIDSLNKSLEKSLTDAIKYANNKRIVHTDIRLSNVIVLNGDATNTSGRINFVEIKFKLIDWGLAVQRESEDEEEEISLICVRLPNALAYASDEVIDFFINSSWKKCIYLNNYDNVAICYILYFIHIYYSEKNIDRRGNQYLPWQGDYDTTTMKKLRERDLDRNLFIQLSNTKVT